MENNNKLLLQLIEQELANREIPRKEPHDHEGSMAKNELRDMIDNGIKVYKKLNDNDELPGWVSSYISLAADYIHTITQYLEEDDQIDRRGEGDLET